MRVRRIGHESLSIFVHYVPNLLSVLDPTSLTLRHRCGFRFFTRAKQFARFTRSRKKTRKGSFFFVRVRRIELPTTAWKAVVLPLNYTRDTPSKPWSHTILAHCCRIGSVKAKAPAKGFCNFLWWEIAGILFVFPHSVYYLRYVL